MKTIRSLAVVLTVVLALAVHAAAQVVVTPGAATVPNLTGPTALDLLQTAANSPTDMATAVDGGLPRTEGPLTVLTEKPFEERHRYPGHFGTGMGRGGYYDPYYGHYGHNHYEPPYTVVTRGMHQRVRIDNRSEYVREESSKAFRPGAIKGGILAALVGAVLGIPLLPLLLTTILGAALVGTLSKNVSASRAKSRPDEFNRDVIISSHREY
jgi:hypothetical protein